MMAVTRTEAGTEAGRGTLAVTATQEGVSEVATGTESAGGRAAGIGMLLVGRGIGACVWGEAEEEAVSWSGGGVSSQG